MNINYLNDLSITGGETVAGIGQLKINYTNVIFTVEIIIENLIGIGRSKTQILESSEQNLVLQKNLSMADSRALTYNFTVTFH